MKQLILTPKFGQSKSNQPRFTLTILQNGLFHMSDEDLTAEEVQEKLNYFMYFLKTEKE